MAIEIERKFIVSQEGFVTYLMSDSSWRSYHIQQTYICDDCRVRVERHSNGFEEAWFMKKQEISENKIERLEWMDSISVEDAIKISALVNANDKKRRTITKHRIVIPFRGLNLEVDIFHGDNQGLLMAEIELPEKDYKIDFLCFEWIGREVTNNEQYYNSNLAKNPYKNWSKNNE